ncbi:MAG: hypothetical protein HC824_02845 [Synechococcales cyanobacterium RM1_1_8]|nr:hypothetical protein [Synechococcales cyanobacterium RM1_1_8]
MNNRKRRHCHRKIHRRQLGATYGLALLLSVISAMEAKADITPDAKTQAAMIESIQDEYQAKGSMSLSGEHTCQSGAESTSFHSHLKK